MVNKRSAATCMQLIEHSIRGKKNQLLANSTYSVYFQFLSNLLTKTSFALPKIFVCIVNGRISLVLLMAYVFLEAEAKLGAFVHGGDLC